MNTKRSIRPTDAELIDAAEMTKTGCFTINEIRAFLGLPPVPHGEQVSKLSSN